LKTLGLFFLIHNIFAALQDVSSDALAVDTLREEELPIANGLMFVAKGLGAMFAVLGLSRVLNDSGFQTAPARANSTSLRSDAHTTVHLRTPRRQAFPVERNKSDSTQVDSSEAMTFSEILGGFRTAISDKPARLALLLCTVMWIGGGMGTGMGIIDFQWNSFSLKNSTGMLKIIWIRRAHLCS
jgi:hypothetical protein